MIVTSLFLGIPVPVPRNRGQEAASNESTEGNKENAQNVSNVPTNQSVDVDKSQQAAPGSPTENIKIDLLPRQQPRRTEADFRLPEGSRRKGPEDCKQQ